MFSVEAFENSLYDAGDGELWDWSSAAVTRKPFTGTVGGGTNDSTSSFNDMYQWMITSDQGASASTLPPSAELDGGETPPARPALMPVKKTSYKNTGCSTKRKCSSNRLSNKRATWTSGCGCGAMGSASSCICGDYFPSSASSNSCGNAMCENGGICTGVCGTMMLPKSPSAVPRGVAGGVTSSSSASSLSRFTLQDENGKRKIRNDIMSIAESLPSLPGLYFDKKQKGFRVRYQNVYVGWVALSRFPSIEEAYCSARDIWENAKAHAEKFQTPQAAIIASLPLQKQAKASGKNRGGRPRTVTQLPPEWGPGGGGTPASCNGGGGGGGGPTSTYVEGGNGTRRLNSWGGGELTAAPSPTDHWSQQAVSNDLLYPTVNKFK